MEPFDIEELQNKKRKCEELFKKYEEAHKKAVEAIESEKLTHTRKSFLSSAAGVASSAFGMASSACDFASLAISTSSTNGALLLKGASAGCRVLQPVAGLGTAAVSSAWNYFYPDQTNDILKEYTDILSKVVKAIEDFANCANQFRIFLDGHVPTLRQGDTSSGVPLSSRFANLFQNPGKNKQFTANLEQFGKFWDSYSATKRSTKLIDLAQDYTRGGIKLSKNHRYQMNKKFKNGNVGLSQQARSNAMMNTGANILEDSLCFAQELMNFKSEDASEYDEIISNLEKKFDEVKKIYESLILCQDEEESGSENGDL